MYIDNLEPPGVVLVKKHNRPRGPLMATGSWSTPRLIEDTVDQSGPKTWIKCEIYRKFIFVLCPISISWCFLIGMQGLEKFVVKYNQDL